MAAGVVDTPIGWSNEFLYDNHGFFGTARAEKMVAYSNTIDFDTAGALTIGAGWQGYNVQKDSTNKEWLTSQNRAQVAAGYTISGFNVNAAFNSGNLIDKNDGNKQKTAESALISAKYGNFGSGLYVAATYADNKHMNSFNNKLINSTKAFDSVLAYGLDFGLNLILKHEELNDEERNERVKSGTSIQAEYTISPRLRAYTGYNYDNQGEGEIYHKNQDHQFIIGTRFYL
jgi:hypothetical protein